MTDVVGSDCQRPDDRSLGKYQRYLAATADVIDRHAVLLYGALITLLAAFFVAAAFFLTVEADESWIMLSTAHTFGIAVPVTDMLGKPTITTGGVHLLLHGILAHVTMNIVAHRFISLAAAAGLLLIVYRGFRVLGHPSARAAAGTALVAATPGFVLQAGLATGEVIAVLFLVAAGFHWTRRSSHSLSAAAMTGVLLGLACAARINCVAAVGGLIAYAVVVQQPDRHRIGRVMLVAVIAFAITAAAAGIYYLIGSTRVIDEGQGVYFATATGVGSARKSIPQIIQSALLLNEYLPIPLLALVTGAWIVRHFDTGRGDPRNRSDLAGVLLFMGIAVLTAWTLFAPIPHLRYLWPALACVWLAGASVVLDAWQRMGSAVTRLVMHGVVVLVCGYALLASGFVAGHGESLTLVYRAIGVSPRLALPREQWFRAASDQRALARFIAGQPASASFFTLYAAGAYPMVYLSGRSIPNIDRMGRTRDRFLVLLPADHMIWQPGGAYFAWKEANTRPAFKSGDFAVLRIGDRAPPPPAKLVSVGLSDIY